MKSLSLAAFLLSLAAFLLSLAAFLMTPFATAAVPPDAAIAVALSTFRTPEVADPFAEVTAELWDAEIINVVAVPNTNYGWHRTYSEAVQDAKRHHKPVLVVVGQAACLPCKQLEANLSTEAVETELRKFACYRTTDPAEAARFEVTVFPTTIVYADGERKSYWTGPSTTEAILGAAKTGFATAPATPIPVMGNPISTCSTCSGCSSGQCAAGACGSSCNGSCGSQTGRRVGRR